VGADTLWVSRAGRDSVLVRLPDTTGFIEALVRVNGSLPATIPQNVYGFRRWLDGPAIASMPYPIVKGGEPRAIVLTDPGAIAEYDYRTRTLRPMTGPNSCHSALNPIPSLADDRLVVMRQCDGSVRTDPAWPTITPPDTLTFPGGSMAAHLRTGRWLVYSTQVGFRRFDRLPGGGFGITQLTPFGSLLGGVRVNPARDRVVPLDFDSHSSSIPVFDTTGIVYTIPGGYIGGAAFSQTGDTLFAMMGGSEPELMAIDARTGALLVQALAGIGSERLQVAEDPGRPFLYLAGLVKSDTLYDVVVRVMDRATLREVGRLRVPHAVFLAGAINNNSVYYNGRWEVIMDAARRRLYLSQNFTTGTTNVYEFDLQP
jgi:hypothetical protein